MNKKLENKLNIKHTLHRAHTTENVFKTSKNVFSA